APSSPDPYPLSLHDALPICPPSKPAPSSTSPPFVLSPGSYLLPERTTTTPFVQQAFSSGIRRSRGHGRSQHWVSVRRPIKAMVRSEEHTSELQSRENLVCRL